MEMTELGLALRLVRVRLGLRWRLWRQPLPVLLAALTPRGGEARVPRARLEQALARAERLLARLRPAVPDTCLYRALGRYALYRRAGMPVCFVAGVHPWARELVGHAWLELDGVPVGEEVDPRLQVTLRYPAAPPGAAPGGWAGP